MEVHAAWHLVSRWPNFQAPLLLLVIGMICIYWSNVRVLICISVSLDNFFTVTRYSSVEAIRSRGCIEPRAWPFTCIAFHPEGTLTIEMVVSPAQRSMCESNQSITRCPTPSVVSFPLGELCKTKITTSQFLQSGSHHLRSHFRTMQSNREKCPVKFQMRSVPFIFVSQQETPQQFENESLAARILRHRKGKVRWWHIWGI
jgi:hypothetical protein